MVSAAPSLFSVGESVGYYWARWFKSNQVPVSVKKGSRAHFYAGEITAIGLYPSGSRYAGAPVSGRRYCLF